MTHKLTFIISILLCLPWALPTQATASQPANNFTHPDFAFPKTVQANALSALDEALKQGDDPNIVLAIIQLTLAKQKVSKESVVSSLQLIEETAHKRGGVAARVLMLYEARLLSDIYSNDQGTYNRRHLPLDSIPQDPSLWSAELFAIRINQLTTEALDDPALLCSTTLERWRNVFDFDSSASAPFYPNLYSILVPIANNILAPFPSTTNYIPFTPVANPSPGEQTASLLDNINRDNAARALSADDTAWYALAYPPSLRNVSKDQKTELLLSAYERLATSPYACELLISTPTPNDNDAVLKHRYMATLKSAVALHPDYFRIDFLKRIITDDSNQGRISVAQQVIPGEEFPVEVRTNGHAYPLYLQIYKIARDDKQPARTISRGGAKLMASYLVTVDTCTIGCNALPAGYYAATLSHSDSFHANTLVSADLAATFTVSNISVYSSGSSLDNKQRRVYVVSAADGAPLKGAEVTFKSYNRGEWKPVSSGHTAADGSINVPASISNSSSHMITVQATDDYYEQNIYFPHMSLPSPSTRVNILTSLGLYKPGQDCEFSIVASRSQAEETRLQANLPVNIFLYNASYQEIDSISLTTDAQGRANGRFTLPTSGMLGNYRLEARVEGKQAGSAYFKVEKYRRPGFYVELQADKSAYLLPDTITLSGRVMSYSGMPMSNAKTEITISFRQPWWRYLHGGQSTYTATATTDEAGRFELQLPTEPLRDTSFDCGFFSAVATSTSSAGETQESEPCVFSLGHVASIDVDVPSKVCIHGDILRFKASIQNVETSAQATYVLRNSKGETVAEGPVAGTAIEISATELPSGQYTLNLIVCDNHKADKSYEFLLYRTSDVTPPCPTPLWIPETDFKASRVGEKIEVTYGGSYNPQYIYIAIAHENGDIEWRTVKTSGDLKKLTLEAPGVDKSMTVSFFAVQNADAKYETVTLHGPSRKIDMEVVTFRDHINAGGHEHWQFKYAGRNTPVANMPVIASLSDNSLNAIYPFSWSWYGFSPAMNYLSGSAKPLYTSSDNFYISLNPKYNFPSLYSPHFNYYNQLCIGGTYYEGAQTGEIEMYAAATPRMAKAKGASNEALMASADTVTEADAVEDSGAETPDSHKAELRPVEMPLAWFKPSLSTDADGLLTLSFDVPDFNTTWQFQILAVNEQGISCYNKLYSTASKPVMVQSTAPRFLRTGDTATLPVTIFNNSGEPADIVVDIVIYNPITQAIIAEHKQMFNAVADSAQCVAFLQFNVPDNIEFVAFKTTARTDSFTDGEQSLISILPSSSPVIETHPFYLAPGDNHYAIDMPTIDSQAYVTLQYCDNPVWYCVTALPSLSLNPGSSILSIVNALYGHSIAYGLVSSNPQIARAIGLWKSTGDSTLVSALQRNPELKSVALTNTPWLSNATAETLRMQQLSDLLDTSSAQQSIEDNIAALLKLQNTDGGWSWCPDMSSSPFITSRVLHRLGMLKMMKYLPSDSRIDMAVKEGFEYVDRCISTDNARYKNLSSATLLNWLYLHTLYPEVNISTAAAPIKAKAIKAVRSDWHSMSISQMATAATTLHRLGYTMQAREILVSLRQQAMQSNERGMWYDNLESAYTSVGTLLTTARVLEAYSEITPRAPEIDKLRQWLILQREAQDWGDNDEVAEVVWSILASGSKWTEPAAMPAVRLNGRDLSLPPISRFTGSFTMPLEAAVASRATITIRRESNGPAWGGVAMQYIAPVDSIRVFSNSDVTITKRLLLVERDASGEHVSEPAGAIKAGQRVRIQLTVTSARDIDYAVINDEQAGCLTPTDPLSGYKYDGETGYYREVRTGVTNLYITYLPKGKYLIEYDCYAEGDGTYCLGIATLQSLYAPMLSAHSAGAEIKVSR